MKLTTFYKIYYRHRIKKASYVLKIYLIITVFFRYIFNLFYLPKKKNLDDYAKENQNLFQKDLNYLCEYFNSDKGEKFKNLILDKMDKSVLPGIKENVVSDFYLTPDYFEKDLATLHGSGFSIQPKFSQSAYFRFHNQSEVFNNLYFVGAGTHPGAGMPGVLSSAKVLDRLFR